MIDFGLQLKNFKEKVAKYISISDEGNCKEAMNKLYAALRSAENHKKVEKILIFNIDNYLN